MDKHLSAFVDRDTPPINLDLANGLAVQHMKEAEKYIDTLFRTVAKDFPEGLTYSGCRRCTPHEEYREMIKGGTTKNGSGSKTTAKTYEVARSDLFLMAYQFRFKGEDLQLRFLQLPFISDGGCLVLGGSRFNISPVLADRVISIGRTSVFIRLLRAKITTHRTTHRYQINDKQETAQVVWGEVYNKNSKMAKLKATVPPGTECTLTHYLFCKYGFYEAFRLFGNCHPVVGGPEINPQTYPPEEWAICKSSQIPPRRWKGFYNRSDIRVAIRHSEMTHMVKTMLGGFFYAVDRFPTRLIAEHIDSKRLWMVLLGHIIWSGNVGEGTLYTDVEKHIKSLDNYLDGIVLAELFDIGIHVTNLYQLFAIITDKFNDWLLADADKISSMYGKKLSCLYFVLYEISSSIFNLGYKLTSAALKKELTIKDIEMALKNQLKPRAIFKIRTGHGEVASLSSPNDNKAFKITSILIPQSKTQTHFGNSGRNAMSDPANRVHVSIVEIGGYTNLPKADPSGRARLNHWCSIDEKGVVQRNPEFIPLLDGIQEKIK